MRLSFALTLLFTMLANWGYCTAAITSVSQTTGINFGTVSAGTGGTINSNVGAPTGGVKKVGGTFQNASFTVAGTASGAQRNIKVFITTAQPVTLSNGGSTSTSTTSFNIPPAATITRVYSVTTGAFSLVVPVYGVWTLANGQTPGTYNGTYSVIACGCSGNSGTCPATPSGASCL